MAKPDHFLVLVRRRASADRISERRRTGRTQEQVAARVLQSLERGVMVVPPLGKHTVRRDLDRVITERALHLHVTSPPTPSDDSSSYWYGFQVTQPHSNPHKKKGPTRRRCGPLARNWSRDLAMIMCCLIREDLLEG